MDPFEILVMKTLQITAVVLFLLIPFSIIYVIWDEFKEDWFQRKMWREYGPSKPKQKPQEHRVKYIIILLKERESGPN